MNRVYVNYCYPTSPMSETLGSAGFYVTIGRGPNPLVISRVFKTYQGAEGFCRNNGLTFEPHRFDDADRVRVAAEYKALLGGI